MVVKAYSRCFFYVIRVIFAVQTSLMSLGGVLGLSQVLL